jgi:hypothetical protein
MVAVALATSATARVTVAPQNNAVPVVSGQAQEGKTLTTSNGTWSNSPTSFAYQWQACDNGGNNCSNITGATQKTYTVAAGDADKTLRVQVTATNADGSTSATSKVSDVVSSKGGPTNTATPTISGTPKVGEELDATTGTWTGGVRSFSYQWQRCDAQGGACVSVQDATAKSYGVRSADVGNTLRVVVTATNLSGNTNAVSSPTTLIATNVPAPAPTPRLNKAPTIRFIGLKRVGHRIYARFAVCDDSAKNVTVVARDSMPGRLGYVRRFSVAPCSGTQSRNWMLIPRFQHQGRFTTTLRAVDKSGKSSRTVGRSLFFNSSL